MSEKTVSAATSGTSEQFIDAVTVWINKPHVVNRRMCGAKVLLNEDLHNFQCVRSFIQNIDSFKGKLLKKISEGDFETGFVSSFLSDTWDKNSDTSEDVQNCVVANCGCEGSVYLRDLLPKQLDKQCTVRELVIVDKTCHCVLFIPVVNLSTCKDVSSSPCQELIYLIEYLEDVTAGGRIQLQLLTDPCTIEPSSLCISPTWLFDQLLPKVIKWSKEKMSSLTQSLRLVPIDKYSERYQLLKIKYGRKLVEIWPEKTDPQKFVYEDVAIATYLLLLWEGQGSSIQRFVDLGCGNGLLVYILSSEGHKGLGLDVRKRNIWDMYGSNTVLQERSITPSDESLFPEFDWLIGNHSDELTPWIPVIAARSSMKTNFFVLPCCHHDFNCKFSRRSAKTSQYRTYLDYVREIGEVCGFKMEEDTLRIPSTKRVCFVGRARNYEVNDWQHVNKMITSFISSRTQTSSAACVEGEASSSSWAGVFVPRESEERVRNCTRVSKDVREKIIDTVVQSLLTAENGAPKRLADGRSWNPGGRLTLSQVAELFDKSTLQQLKQECGGLQTLLRNNHHVFRVVSGTVQLRDWSERETPGNISRKPKRQKTTDVERFHKTKLCWFHEHHPDGCPLDVAVCSFGHGKDDLRCFGEKEK